ncbi:MAG TPA: cytochrome b N-terminal domain-containing protein [Gemmatimonadales bacterium]
MAPPPRLPERAALRLLSAADAACNRLYGSRWNPLYQSGSIVVALLAALIVTGLWLLLFYRVGAPYASVARISADPWVGSWIRGVHRYASDAAVVAVAVHAFRMFAQVRSWGPRALAWTTGVIMLALLYVCGLTGYVMVWDTFGHRVAQEGARMLDALPILSEPVGRAFTGEEALLGPFFFLNLFAHIAIPLGLGLVLWLHVSRVARPVLLPPRRVAVALLGALVAVSVALPVRMQPEANPFRLPETVRMDVFFGFWLPLVRPLDGGVALVAVAVAGLALLLVPVATRRRGAVLPAPSVVDEDLCTGCRQCALDCPYEAITMVERAPGGRSAVVARVDPALCVSCGICAGSCAPMAVGPPGRTGREQLPRVREMVASGEAGPGRTVVVCCERGARGWGDTLAAVGAVVHPVDCTGSMHTSVVELLVRGGASGVLVLSCPPSDCWNREGPRWMLERIYHDREAELKARVDRRRVRVAYAAASEELEALTALRSFMADTSRLPGGSAEHALVLEELCEQATVEERA